MVTHLIRKLEDTRVGRICHQSVASAWRKSTALFGQTTQHEPCSSVDRGATEAQSQLHALIEAIPQQVWTARPDGAVDYVNDRILAYFNRTLEHITGWEWKEVIHPDDLPACLEQWERARQTGEPYEIEFRLRRHDGVYLWHIGRALPLRDQDGRIVKWFGTNTDVSSLKRTEQALQKNEEKYRLLYEDNPTMYFTVAPDGLIQSVNRFGAEQLGYSVQELIGKPVISVFHPDDRVTVEEQFARCLNNPARLWQWEFRKVKKNGSTMWVKEIAKTITDLDGRTNVLIVCEDITELKFTETVLRSSEERFRALAQSAKDAIITATQEGQIVFWNAGARELFGYEECEIAGKLLEMLIPSRYRAAHREGLRRASKTGESRLPGKPLELEALRKDGSEVPIELSLGSYVIGGSRYFTGIIRDITDRKRAEAELKHAYEDLEIRVQQRTVDLEYANKELQREVVEREQAEKRARHSKERTRALVAAIPDLILLYSADGTILDMSPERGAMTQLNSEECRGKNVREVLPARLAEQVQAYIHKALKTREIQVSEYETTRDGVKEHFEVRFVANGKSEVISLVRNVTDRKRMESVLRDHAENLERLVEERTAKIQQLETRLAQSEKLAALGQLAAGVAHEINNPLAAVSNGFALLSDAVPVNHPAYSYIKIIDRGIDRMSKIIQQMYQLFGAGSKERTLLHLDAVIDDVLKLLSFRGLERNVTIQKVLPPDLPPMVTSETELAQVLTNLIQNAIDASPDGAVVTLGAHMTDMTVNISVTDAGSGISEEMSKKIFEPFFTTKTGKQRPRMGLGLSISNSLVQAMGGRIDVHSEQNQGTTFTVELPLSVLKTENGHGDTNG